MSNYVYASLSRKQFFDAMFRSPPTIVADEVPDPSRNLLVRLFGPKRILLTAEIPPLYFTSEACPIILAYERPSLEVPFRFDYAALQKAVLIEADEHAPIRDRDLASVRKDMGRTVNRRDTAYAVSSLDLHLASFAAARELDVVADVQSAILRVPTDHRGGFMRLEYRYFPLAMAEKHADAPLPEPAYFRRIAETATAAP